MAIAPLLVRIATAGANQLRQLGNNMRQFGANLRVAANAWRNSFIARGGIPGALRRLPNALRNAARQFRNVAQNARQAARALATYLITSRLVSAASSGMAKALATAVPLMAKWGAIIGAITVVALPLIGAIGNLLPLVMLIAPAAAAAGLAVVGLKLAFNGVGDALRAGLSGDTEEFEKALKKLAPQAADTVRVLVKLRDVWKPLARDFQGRVFQGAASEVASLSRFIKPIADKWLPKLAQRFAETRSEIADGLARFAADGRLEAVWRNIHAAVSSLLGAVKPLAQAFGDILQVASPRFAKLSDDVRSLAERFADWIRGARDSGKLQEWLDKAIMTFGQLKDIVVNVSTTIAGIMGASSEEGTGTLDNIVRQTKAMSDWVNSGDGQKMIDTFAKVGQAISDAGPMLQVVMYFIGLTGDAWKALAAIAKGAWEGIVAAAAWAINWILSGYEKVMRAAAAAADAMGMDGLAAKLRGAANAVAGFRDDVNNYLNGIKKTVDITVNYRARMIGPHMVSGAQQSGTYSSGIGGRAVGGPMRAGVMYRVNEQGQEFIQLGTSGRAYNARESAGMFGGGGTWIPAPTNANRDLLRAFEKAQRRQVRTRAGGSAQRYLGAAGAL